MRRTVLLVDDEKNVRSALRRALRHESCEILEAESAAEALRLLESRPVAVVVSDESMPGMSGTELLARVRAEYPETFRIILTGHASLEIAIRSINEGAVYRFFTKPCRPDELVGAIRQALQQRELLLQSRRLLQTVRRQTAAMRDLEREARGITHVDRDDSGAIVLTDDGPTDVDALLDEIRAELGDADERLGARINAP